MAVTDEESEEKRTELVESAKEILRGKQQSANECLSLAKQLKMFNEMRWARRLLDITVERGVDDHKLAQKIAQTRALVTYKDTQLEREDALNRALEILHKVFDLVTTEDQETLGLVGAIYKRKWEVDTDKLNLEHALRYYRRGFNAGVENDAGYTSINTAFVQDLLAHIEENQAREAGIESLTAEVRRDEARKIRRAIVDTLHHVYKNKGESGFTIADYWPIVTLAEAYFGLNQYSDAKEWLRQAKSITEISEWEYVSTAKQLAHLAQIQADRVLSDDELVNSDAWQALYEFLGNNASAVRSMFLGKMGLALSGGGFRASFYHIGVLAKLAELDLLRHVEVMSCVSGGSIVGVHYYLELRRLINKEKKRDVNINRQDYVDLVTNTVDDFLAGVQKNPRVRILANPLTNLKMLFSSSYSRTQRLGELYEKLIYSRINDGEGAKDRCISGLFLTPVEKPKGFLPRRDNWSRNAKIPELILNATTLNSGHNWQFTASWMGESPSSINREVDTNKRFRRMYYKEAPDKFKNVRLGSAVGASSCVPGLFEPLVLSDLYANTTLRLVDGGVYDNQGVSSLFEQDCDVILVSDATGQMTTEEDPGGGILKPLLRTNTVMMNRIRDTQYQELKVRQRGSLLRGMMYVHMKQGLDAETVDWNQCEEPPETLLKRPSIVTPYGIRKDIQERLSAMRTDLDSFSDREAYALMTSGYHATGHGVLNLKGFPVSNEKSPEWKFLMVERGMKSIHGDVEEYQKMMDHLKVSQFTFFKIFKLSKPLNIFTKILAGLLISVLIYLWVVYPDYKPFESMLTEVGSNLSLSDIMSTFAFMLAGFILVAIIGPRKTGYIKRFAKWRDTLNRIGVGLGIGLVGWLGAQIHLRIFDRLFLYKGRLKNSVSDE